MSLSQQRFFSVDVGLGLRVVQRQTQAALKLDEALRAPDAPRMWQSVRDARASLEQLEVELHRAEYPPFDRWYGESWIRSALNESNPHRPYIQVRAFISSEGTRKPGARASPAVKERRSCSALRSGAGAKRSSEVDLHRELDDAGVGGPVDAAEVAAVAVVWDR